MNRLWDIFRTVNDFVRFSDTKAAVVLAFAGGSAAFLSGKVEVLHDIIAAHKSDAWGILLYIAVTGYLVALVLTMVWALKSIWPSLHAGEGRSLVYFKHIAEDFEGNPAKYAKALRALDDVGIEEQLAHQICVNASVATAKFKAVGKAIRALVFAVSFWGVIVFLILLVGTTSALE